MLEKEGEGRMKKRGAFFLSFFFFCGYKVIIVS